jgi:hypothetical protein
LLGCLWQLPGEPIDFHRFSVSIGCISDSASMSLGPGFDSPHSNLRSEIRALGALLVANIPVGLALSLGFPFVVDQLRKIRYFSSHFGCTLLCHLVSITGGTIYVYDLWTRWHTEEAHK